MKYVLKGLKFKGEIKSEAKGNINVDINIAEIELEGSFEEVMKTSLEILKNTIK